MAESNPKEFVGINSYFQTIIETFLWTLGRGYEDIIRSTEKLLLKLAMKDVVVESSIEIVAADSNFAMMVETLRKHINLVEDCYHAIHIGIKGVVDYGTSDTLPDVQKLIQEKEFRKATGKMENFLNNLKDRIKVLKNDVDNMEKNYNPPLIKEYKNVKYGDCAAVEDSKESHLQGENSFGFKVSYKKYIFYFPAPGPVDTACTFYEDLQIKFVKRDP